MILLSEMAWRRAEPIYRNILGHPFIQGLMDGTLEQEIFNFYIIQDMYYLEQYAKCMTLIAQRIYPEYQEIFINYAKDTEQEYINVRSYYVGNSDVQPEIGDVAINYSNFILSACESSDIAVSVAAILPCFWVYNEVGNYLNENALIVDNKYSPWISAYSSQEFDASLAQVIDIFNNLGSYANISIIDQMLDTYYNGTLYEYGFWNEAYHVIS